MNCFLSKLKLFFLFYQHAVLCVIISIGIYLCIYVFFLFFTLHTFQSKFYSCYMCG